MEEKPDERKDKKTLFSSDIERVEKKHVCY
jgi:hypothetical protein